MRILNIMLARDLGGMEQASIDYAKALINGGHEVINVITKGAKIADLIPGIKEFVFNFGNWDFFSACKLKRIIKKYNPDFILTHGTRPIKFLKMANVQVPIIGITHDYYKKSTIAAYSYCIAVTQDTKNYLIKQGMKESQIEIVPNMVLVPKLHNNKKRKPNKPLVIGLIGRFESRKGFDDFILAFKILKNQGFDLHAVIAGGGCDEWEVKFKNMINDNGLSHNIKLLGWVNDKEAFYKSIDIFCFPSRHETFGIALIEAMSYGLPIVSTNAQGPRELLQDSKDSIICNIGDPLDMAEKLKLLVNNPDLREVIGKNARQKVEDLYSTSKVYSLINDTLVKFKNYEIQRKQITK